MLISYKITIGTETIIWLAISGGVMIAERIKTITKANFLYFLKYSGVTTPIFVRMNMSIGNSKINPLAITEARTNAI